MYEKLKTNLFHCILIDQAGGEHKDWAAAKSAQIIWIRSPESIFPITLWVVGPKTFLMMQRCINRTNYLRARFEEHGALL